MKPCEHDVGLVDVGPVVTDPTRPSETVEAGRCAECGALVDRAGNLVTAATLEAIELEIVKARAKKRVPNESSTHPTRDDGARPEVRSRRPPRSVNLDRLRRRDPGE